MSHRLKPTILVLGALAFTLGVAGCPGGDDPPPQDPCEGVVCGAGRCEAHDGRAACACDAGYHAEGLTCVKDNQPPLNPCDPNPCVQPGRNQCLNVEGRAVCGCNPGTVEGPGGTCVTPSSPMSARRSRARWEPAGRRTRRTR